MVWVDSQWCKKIIVHVKIGQNDCASQTLTLLSLVGGVYYLCRWRSRRAYHVVAREDTTPWHEDGDTACATTGQFRCDTGQ